METQSVSSLIDNSTRHFGRIRTILVAVLMLAATKPLAATTDYASQVTQARLFMEPLAWVGKGPPPEIESGELLGDIGIFKSDGVDEGFVALEHFLTGHPHSAWAPALEVNMAEYDRRTGLYSQALSHWQAAWDATKNSKDAVGQKIAVQAFAGWTRLLASLGHATELTGLYAELDALHLRLGVYATTIQETRDALGIMEARPGLSYRCGSYALGHLAMALHGKQSVIRGLFDVDSPNAGFTMAEILALAKTNGLAVEAVRRPAGAKLIVPCVVHWKLNHYAAITEEKNGRYLVEDPTFEGDIWIDGATIDAESSGDFILPSD
ncbi:MAG TPA: cysteine peptidase family C39 domain-containing protein, partial [Candidatus Acidoferrales bacterium]|nr:cysteine peptidase family C39 domain-containing protein [Candidatus Acidoferrales bacterium]